MSRYNTIGTHKTVVVTDEDGITKVQYHDTVVVSFTPHRIVLNTGGWKTATTKKRMNQASLHYRLGYLVHQDKGRWYCSPSPNVLPVPFDGDTFTIDR
jgi:hypothetical protein